MWKPGRSRPRMHFSRQHGAFPIFYRLMPRQSLLSLLLSVAALGSALAEDLPVSLPGVLRLTHEAAVQMALSRNFSIQVSSYDPQVAQQRLRSALGRFDPEFIAGAEHTENSRRDFFVNNGFDLAQTTLVKNEQWNVGFGGLTPWGLRYDLGMANRTTTSSTSQIRDQSITDLTLNIIQPLLRGFGPAANLSEVRVARNNIADSEWAFRERIIDILTTTDFVYNDLHAAKEALKAAERSLALAEQLVTDNEARVKIGVKSPLDVTEARATAAARVETVIITRQLVNTNTNLLKQLVSNELEPMLSVRVEIAPPPSPVFFKDVTAGIRQALELRPDYRRAILLLQNRQVILAFRDNDSLPRFDLTGSLGLVGFDRTMAESLSRLTSREQIIWSAGGVVRIPFPNRTGRGAEEGARLQVAQQLVALKELEQRIVVQVDNTSGEVVTARERVRSTDAARRLAQETLDAGQERLNAGVLTTFEVLELQRRLALAEAAEIRARADYNKSVTEYYRQSGTTLLMYNVKVQ